jgi:hypothetical protein
MTGMSKRILCMTVILAVSVLLGCDRKEEAVSEKLAVAASASSERGAALPVEPVVSAATVADSGGGGSSAGGNRPPRVIAVPFKEARIHRGVDIEVMPEGLDPDGDLVDFRYEWFINGEKLTDFDEPVLPGDRFQKGDRIALRIVPSDGKVDGLPFTGQPFTVPNAPPRFTSSPPQQFEAQTYLYESRAEDPDGEALTYSLEAGPPGMTIDAGTGKVAWQIGQEQAGDHLVKIVAQDAEGLKAVQEYSLIIRIEKQEVN